MGFDMDLDDLADKVAVSNAPAQVSRPVAPVANPSVQKAPVSTPMAPMSAPSGTSRGVQISSVKPSNPINLDSLLTILVKNGGSDLHLSVGTTPMIRKSGKMLPIEGAPVLTPENISYAFQSIVSPEQWDRLSLIHI